MTEQKVDDEKGAEAKIEVAAPVDFEQQNKAIEAKAEKDNEDIEHLIELAKSDGATDPFSIIQDKAKVAAEEDFKELDNREQLIQHLNKQAVIEPRKQKINKNIMPPPKLY